MFNGALSASQVFNGALSATHTRSNITSGKNQSSHSCGFFNGNFNGPCLLAMLCCLMTATAVFNETLSASPSFVLMGLFLAKFLMGLCPLAYCIILLLKTESSHSCVV